MEGHHDLQILTLFSFSNPKRFFIYYKSIYIHMFQAKHQQLRAFLTISLEKNNVSKIKSCIRASISE
jgi:hypothetical protein